MKRFLKLVAVLGLIGSSTAAYAGELIYRDGVGGANCSVLQDVSKQWVDDGNGGSIVTTTIRTLTCSGKLIARHTQVCDVNCSGMNQIVSSDHDFNPNIPGVKPADIIFGSVSVKSPANVFAARDQSKNYLAYSNDGILDKPVIFVEGYDPDNNIFPDFYYYAGMWNLMVGGRDLIIINFSDGAKDMDANAAFLQSVILEMNASKVGNYPLAVIGYSMGGIVARKALKQMELSGQPHNTSLYVSYDAPHMGANSPQALADTIDGLVAKLDSATGGYTKSALKRAQRLYKSDAARQMLIGGSNFQSATAEDFPINLTRVAVTSGSLLGPNGMQSNSVAENQFIAGFKFYLWHSSGGALLPSSSLSKDFTWYSRGIDGVYYDNVPGSNSNIFKESYVKLQDAADKFTVRFEPQSSNVTFIPTVSALAMPSAPQAPVIDDFKYDSPFDRYIAVNPLGGVDACEAFDSQNAVGENILHNPGESTFNQNQLAQLKCAISAYHVPGSVPPSRFLKIGRELSTALIMVPVNHLLLM